MHSSEVEAHATTMEGMRKCVLGTSEVWVRRTVMERMWLAEEVHLGTETLLTLVHGKTYAFRLLNYILMKRL